MAAILEVAAILTTITNYHADLPILLLGVQENKYIQTGKISTGKRVALCAKHGSRPGK